MAIKKKPKPPQKENGERWMVSYSDFITLLLALFIILYSMASADAKAAGSDGSGQAAALAAIASGFGNTIFDETAGGDSFIQTFSGNTLAMLEQATMQTIADEIQELATGDLGLSNDAIEVTIDEIGIHIKIKDTVLFASGSADISNQKALNVLTKIGDALQNFPTNYIQIEGHTDNVPMSGNIKHLETNWELGSLRAVTVLRTLVNKCALNPEFLSATSYGEFRPIASNATPEGRAQNRRVEITILRNYEVVAND